MRRALTWGVVAAAAFVCAISGLYLYRSFMKYNDLQNDINRQLVQVNTLRIEQSQDAPRITYNKSVSETVSYLSAQINRFDLSEQSLQSEKSDSASGDWEEWRIKAVCTGSADNLNTFIDTLETTSTYHDVNFSVDMNNESLYELSIELSFYARRV